MNSRYMLPFFLLLFLLNACSKPSYMKQNSAFIVLKSPAMQYADQGFIYERPDEVKVEIYGNGQALFSLRVTEDAVCNGPLRCMDKKTFHAKVLSAYYPEDTLDAIFRFKPVFGGRGMVKKRNGFTQKLINGNKYHIEYSVLNNQAVFRDTINHILIKIKRL